MVTQQSDEWKSKLKITKESESEIRDGVLIYMKFVIYKFVRNFFRVTLIYSPIYICM